MGNDDWDSRDIKHIYVSKEMPVPLGKKDYCYRLQLPQASLHLHTFQAAFSSAQPLPKGNMRCGHGGG